MTDDKIATEPEAIEAEAISAEPEDRDPEKDAPEFVDEPVPTLEEQVANDRATSEG